MPSLVHLPADSTPEAVYEVLERDGGVVIDGILTPEQTERYKSELLPYIETAPGGDDDFAGKKTARISGLFVKSSVARELAVHPLVKAMCEKVLLPFCDAYQVNVTEAPRIFTRYRHGGLALKGDTSGRYKRIFNRSLFKQDG